MKKQLIFKYTEKEGKSYFELTCGTLLITSIPYETLVLSAKDLYENLFSEIKRNSKIEISLTNEILGSVEKEVSKRGTIIFGILEELIKNIVEEINSFLLIPEGLEDRVDDEIKAEQHVNS